MSGSYVSWLGWEVASYICMMGIPCRNVGQPGAPCGVDCGSHLMRKDRPGHALV